MSLTDAQRQDLEAIDYLDAIRLALNAQDDPEHAVRVVQEIVDTAPHKFEGEPNRGPEILIGLILSDRLQVHVRG